MTFNNYKLPLKHDPYANHLLSWSIVDEIRYGNQSFDGLRDIVVEGRIEEVRRYAEVLCYKTTQVDTIFDILLNALNERCRHGKDRVEDFVYEFRDWGFHFSRTKRGVSQDIKAIKWK